MVIFDEKLVVKEMKEKKQRNKKEESVLMRMW